MIAAVGLSKEVRLRRARPGRPAATLRVVDDVSLEISAGETVGVLGPPGPGRTALGRLLAGQIAPDAGAITISGIDIHRLDKREREGRLASLEIIGDGRDQLPGRRARVGDTLAAAVEAGIAARQSAGDTVLAPALASTPDELLALVGLNTSLAAARIGDLSQRQLRLLSAAQVVAVRPALVVLDAPVAAGDDEASVAIRRVMLRLRDELGTSLVIMGDSLDEVVELSDRILVVYLGRAMEELEPADIADEALHPYTHALVSAADPSAYSTRIALKGSSPDPNERPTGCVFRLRCFQAQERCADEIPELAQPLGATHRVACHFPSIPVRSGASAGGQKQVAGLGSPEPTGREFAEE